MVLLREETLFSHGDSKMGDHLNNAGMSGEVQVEVACTAEVTSSDPQIIDVGWVVGIFAGECSC